MSRALRKQPRLWSTRLERADMAHLTFVVVTIDPETGCWVTDKAPNQTGYVHLRTKGRNELAHRWMYEQLVGPIPTGLHIDHLCRNRACINVEHMEVVTNQQNTLRGVGPTAVNAAKQECIRGHEFTPENTYLRPDDPRQRQCKKCARIRERARRARKKSYALLDL